MERNEERARLTRADIMERMRECWEKLRFDRKLTKREEELIGYNFNLIELYIRLHGEPEQNEHLFACGFEMPEDEEDSDEWEDE